ncbi:DNA helicase IV (75 kDa helicase), partial [Durusdinium trenchii]
MLLEQAKSLHDKTRAKVFTRVLWAILQDYSRRLDEAKEIDFDSMIADAIKMIETGQYQSPYSLILVDEFQDISEPRANLIKALRQQRPSCKVFAVGDDWQSIYRFAGSDISLFTQFHDHFGYSFKRRDYAEIKKALEPVVIEHYHKIISTCIKHIRARHLTLEMLLEQAKSLHDKTRAKVFTRVLWAILQDYSRRLDEAKEIDFDSMIADAIKMIETGQYQSPYSLILVDEFQDISEPRANLIKALRQQRPSCKVFAVGDDWQSIYRFAGSDISLFTQFHDHFGESWTGRLEQTYRCNQLIAET